MHVEVPWNAARWLQAMQRGLAARPRWFVSLGGDMLDAPSAAEADERESASDATASAPAAVGATTSSPMGAPVECHHESAAARPCSTGPVGHAVSAETTQLEDELFGDMGEEHCVSAGTTQLEDELFGDMADL